MLRHPKQFSHCRGYYGLGVRPLDGSAVSSGLPRSRFALLIVKMSWVYANIYQ